MHLKVLNCEDWRPSMSMRRESAEMLSARRGSGKREFNEQLLQEDNSRGYGGGKTDRR
jgi:hypothetical protein